MKRSKELQYLITCPEHGESTVVYVSGEKTCWHCFKLQIKTQDLSYESIYGYDFIKVKTLRSQDSDSWNGSRKAFEDQLVLLGIGWFVYIKSYIDRLGRSVPLVVGKSGTTLVKLSYSDLSFSTDVSDGPARRFLMEEQVEWDKESILVLPCQSESEALYIESSIPCLDRDTISS